MNNVPTLESIKKLAARFKYLEAADEALELIAHAKASGDERLMIRVQTLASEFLARTNDFHSALAMLFEAHELARARGFNDLLFNILRNLGAAFLELDRPLDALEYLERARIQLETEPNLLSERERLLALCSVIHNTGQAHVEVADLKRAKELYKESIDIATRCEDDLAIGISCVNFAVSCKRMDNLSEASMYFEIAKEKFTALNHLPHLATTNVIYSEVKENLGDPQEAVQMLKSALEYFRSIHDVKGEIAAIGALVRIHVNYDSTRDYELAEYYLRYAIECAKSSRLDFLLTGLYRQMSDYCRHKGDFQNAFVYGELYCKHQMLYERSVIEGAVSRETSDSIEKIIRTSFDKTTLAATIDYPFVLRVRDVKLLRAFYSSLKQARASVKDKDLFAQTLQTLRGYAPQLKKFLRNASKAKV